MRLKSFLFLFQAEERIQARRQARAEAREIRLKEIERQQREVIQFDVKFLNGQGSDAVLGQSLNSFL